MRYLITLSVWTLLWIYGCSNGSSSSPTAAASNEEQIAETDSITRITLTAEQLKNTDLKVGELEKRPISETLQVFGKIDVPPQNMVSISMPMGGYLRTTKLLPGMHVNRGEVLARMEDQQYIQLQQDYLTTKAQLASLEKAYQRQLKLNTNQAGSDKALQQAEADYKSARIALRALGERLRLINISPDRLDEDHISRSIQVLSPIDGFVSKVNVNVGKYVNAAEVLFELVNPADIHLNLTVFEKDLDKLSVGQAVKAYTNSNPQKKYDAEIILISRDLDSAHTAEVHCHFESYDPSLRPGTYMNGQIELANQQAYVVPSEALVSKDGQDYVFLQEGPTTFQLKAVDQGAREEGYVQLKTIAGIAGKKLVTQGAYALWMEMNKDGEEEE
ncbi:efflux RND transporter periplasmic adaptor subunit [Olivibacter ginsenosidimutans]|uniref:Efflux RND transporter periplasmic adaptor subunit n=1 Tax=Olivibacter ginsenosidimutans TaxID=1176537 RepID=A0ABP9BA02_9SPHI